MNRSTIRLALLLFGSASLALVGCNDYKTPTAPSSPGNPTPGPAGASISITSSGLMPATVQITPGQSVTFVNSDSAAHQIASTPIPTYDGCPAINQVGRLEPGQSMQTGALNQGACSFLDLLRTGDARWQGSITVQ